MFPGSSASGKAEVGLEFTVALPDVLAGSVSTRGLVA